MILITPYMSQIVTPYKKHTVNGISCWFSIGAYAGPTLLSGALQPGSFTYDAGDYCSEQWSTIMYPFGWSGAQSQRPPGYFGFCPNTPNFPTLTFHA
jgi:hypothetical protein